MLRGNLSSRPFYNEGLVSMLLAVALLGVLALTTFNILQFTTLSGQRTALDLNIARDRAEAARIRSDIEAAIAGVDLDRLQALASSAAEANALIAQRTFSWTRFFDIVEGALPYEVRLLGVAHRLEADDRVLLLNLVAQEDEQLNEFVRAMLETGAFYDVFPVEKVRDEDGTMSAVVEASYLPPVPAAGTSQASGRPTPQGGRP